MDKSGVKIEIKKVEGRSGIKIIIIEGILDMFTSLEAEKIIMPLIDREKYLILDCANLNYMNTAGLILFLKCSTKMRRKNGDFKIANPHKFIFEILDLSGLVNLLEIYPTLEEALKSMPA